MSSAPCDVCQQFFDTEKVFVCCPDCLALVENDGRATLNETRLLALVEALRELATTEKRYAMAATRAMQDFFEALPVKKQDKFDNSNHPVCLEALAKECFAARAKLAELEGK